MNRKDGNDGFLAPGIGIVDESIVMKLFVAKLVVVLHSGRSHGKSVMASENVIRSSSDQMYTISFAGRIINQAAKCSRSHRTELTRV